MNWKNECVAYRKCKIIQLKEPKAVSECRINNPDALKLEIVRIDGCEIISGRRCDYLVHAPSLMKVLLIELKGADFPHGITQLAATLQKYKADFKNHDVICYVICSQFPRAGTNKQIHQKKFKKAHGRLLRIEKYPHSIQLRKNTA